MTETDQQRLRAGAWVRVHRDVVRVQGPDAGTFLQGQTSQNIAALSPADSAWSFLLAPQGKVDAWGRVTRWDDDVYLFDTDVGFGELVVARLERFKMRTDAEVILDTAWTFWGVRGPVEVHVEHEAGAPVLALPIWWSGMVGYDLIAPEGTSVHLGIHEAAPEAAEAVRIECGVPTMGAEITDRTIPAEVGPWIIEASVSFTKGCFTGQELVARIDSRGGNVPKRLRALVLDDASQSDPRLLVGAEIVVDESVVGEVTSSTFSDALGTIVAVGYVGRAVEPPAPAMLRTDDGPLPCSIRELPLLGE